MQDNHDKVTLKLIPKPEGFELRDRRSDKTGKGCDWLPADAVYQADHMMKQGNTIAVVVVWMEERPDGSQRVYRRFAGETGNKLRLLMEAIGTEMGWKE